MILAIDTSAAQCAVALLGEGRAHARREAMARGHAEALFPMIEALLAEAGVSFDALARIAVCTGPGSFTGLRIGIGAARGLALALDVPAVGVSRFEALAAAAGGPVAVALAGRPGTAFLQSFDAALTPAHEPRVIAAEALGPEAGRHLRRAGEGWGPLATDLAEGLPDPLVLARLAGAIENAPPPAPLYLREADAAPPREAPPVLLD